jgi:PAS domain S-box-containing protein
MHLPHRNLSVGLTIALVATAVATLLRMALNPILGTYLPYSIYLLAVVATAWVGGFWPGIVATLLGYLAAEVFFIHPYGSAAGPFSEIQPAEFFRFISYALVGVAISFVSEQWHRVRVRDLMRSRRLEEEVAERLRAAEDLRQSKQTLEALVAAAPIPIVVIEPDRTVRLWNQAAERTFGWTAEEVVGREIPIVPDEKCEECLSSRNAVSRGETLGPIVTYRKRKNGTLVDIELSAAPLYNADSLVDSMVLLLKDVTEQRRAERSLRESQALLRETDQRKDAFLATLAHELRNPLAPIRHGLQVMRLAGDDARLIEQSRDMIERQLGQMVRLIEDLIDVSRITRGTIELRKHRMHLQDSILSAVETSRPVIDSLEHELTVTLPEEPIALDADLTRLSQAFANLLHNAAKYTDKGGRIALHARRDGGRAIVSVSDTGIGIAPEMLPRIFGLFMQGDSTHKESRGGLGVGLSLVKQLIEGHGGSVEARSKGAGRGSEFVITLPVLDLPRADGSRPTESSRAGDGPRHPESARHRVLVVDDNADAVESLATLIRLMGHDCDTALDGEEAIAIARSYAPDTILLDIGMPGINGYDACRAIRKEEWGREIFMVALTGWGQAEDRERTRTAGFDMHIVKPAEPSVLLELLARPRKHSANPQLTI